MEATMQGRMGEAGELRYLEVAPPDAPADLPLVVALHGRGASMDDLAPLAPELDATHYRYIFPNGRLPVDLGGWLGYAWYNVGQQAADVPGSRAAIEALLGELWARGGLGPAQTVLMGFSQGAVLTLDVGLRSAERFAGLVAMSGYLFEDTALPAALARARDQRILIVHGVHDPVLPIDRGRAARQALEAAGLQPEYHEFPIGHEVSAASLAVVRDFVHAVLPPG
ncbi:MAG TPA: hypothetical protein VII06_02535 [Chloroflexota bacterium]|jgi:phospholipase/carboxylesterase